MVFTDNYNIAADLKKYFINSRHLYTFPFVVISYIQVSPKSTKV